MSAQEPVPKEQTITREDIQNMPDRSGPLDHGPQFQDTTLITGKVLDENGDPLPFATIHVKNTRMGTNSDFDGNYVLRIPRDLSAPKDITLVFTFVGYDTHHMELGKALSKSTEPIVVNMEFADQSVIAFGVTVGASRRAGLWTELRRIFGKRYHNY